MSRSGSVKPLIMSLVLALRSDGMLSSGFQVGAQRVPMARSGQRAWACATSSRDNTSAAWFWSRRTSMLFRNSYLSAGDKWFIFTFLRCRTYRAPGETVKKASSVIQPWLFSPLISSVSSGNGTSTAISSSLVTESNVSGHGAKTSS